MTTPGQSGPWSNGNERVPHTLQIFRTVKLPSDAVYCHTGSNSIFWQGGAKSLTPSFGETNSWFDIDKKCFAGRNLLWRRRSGLEILYFNFIGQWWSSKRILMVSGHWELVSTSNQIGILSPVEQSVVRHYAQKWDILMTRLHWLTGYHVSWRFLVWRQDATLMTETLPLQPHTLYPKCLLDVQSF